MGGYGIQVRPRRALYSYRREWEWTRMTQYVCTGGKEEKKGCSELECEGRKERLALLIDAHGVTEG
jgi:hypothetical protein